MLRGIWAGGSDFTGRHYDVDDARAFAIPDPVPPLYFGGSSEAGMRVAARRADVHLTWGEPPDAVAEKLVRLRKYAAEEGRELRYGIRLHTISRDTSEEAWAVAQRMYDQFDPEAVAASQASFAAGDSVGQKRMAALHGGRLGSAARSLEIHPNLEPHAGAAAGGGVAGAAHGVRAVDHLPARAAAAGLLLAADHLLGINKEPKVTLLAIAAFPPVAVAATTAVIGAPKSLVEAARAMDAWRWRVVGPRDDLDPDELRARPEFGELRARVAHAVKAGAA